MSFNEEEPSVGAKVYHRRFYRSRACFCANMVREVAECRSHFWPVLTFGIRLPVQNTFLSHFKHGNGKAQLLTWFKSLPWSHGCSNTANVHKFFHRSMFMWESGELEKYRPRKWSGPKEAMLSNHYCQIWNQWNWKVPTTCSYWGALSFIYFLNAPNYTAQCNYIILKGTGHFF